MFKNPTPVVVALIPVQSKDGSVGLLCIRRGDPPQVGCIALPGGYLEIEEWRAGLVRELKEELDLQIDPEEFEAFDVCSGRNNGVLLVFGLSGVTILEENLPKFTANSEVTERLIIREPIELAFPSHTNAMKRFFDENDPARRGGRSA